MGPLRVRVRVRLRVTTIRFLKRFFEVSKLDSGLWASFEIWGGAWSLAERL